MSIRKVRPFEWLADGRFVDETVTYLL
jgi:hypothetical protein